MAENLIDGRFSCHFIILPSKIKLFARAICKAKSLMCFWRGLQTSRCKPPGFRYLNRKGDADGRLSLFQKIRISRFTLLEQSLLESLNHVGDELSDKSPAVSLESFLVFSIPGMLGG